MKRIITIICLCSAFMINADPAPLNLEIGKATISDLKKQYKSEFIDKNVYSKGDMYELDVNSIGIDGLQNVTAIFDRDKKLVAILTTFPKHKFDYLYKTMTKKYKLTNKNIPFVGNKSAVFKDGDTTVFIDAPHLGFEMTMNYVNNGFWRTYQTKQREEQQLKNKNEESKL